MVRSMSEVAILKQLWQEVVSVTWNQRAHLLFFRRSRPWYFINCRTIPCARSAMVIRMAAPGGNLGMGRHPLKARAAFPPWGYGHPINKSVLGMRGITNAVTQK